MQLYLGTHCCSIIVSFVIRPHIRLNCGSVQKYQFDMSCPFSNVVIFEPFWYGFGNVYSFKLQIISVLYISDITQQHISVAIWSHIEQ